MTNYLLSYLTVIHTNNPINTKYSAGEFTADILEIQQTPPYGRVFEILTTCAQKSRTQTNGSEYTQIQLLGCYFFVLIMIYRGYLEVCDQMNTGNSILVFISYITFSGVQVMFEEVIKLF